MKNFIATVCLVLALSSCSSPDITSDSSEIVKNIKAKSSEKKLPLEKYFENEVIELENGLRVVLHKDTSVPFVDIALYFHVGSKNEPEGKSGFAHLFEHLLFNGTPNAPGEFFDYIDEIGGIGANGSTSRDFTNYYEYVPKTSLEAALWLEADRMANILDGITKEKVQTQIEVVKNEKGLGENEPFGVSYETTLKALFPKGHPYHHSTIGSVEDLESASLEDFEAWFETYYGARNAVLSIVGDIDYAEAEALVRKYFSHIRPGPDITQLTSFPIKRNLNTRHEVRDEAPRSRLERTYIFPPVKDAQSALPAFAADIMVSGEYSILKREIVEKLNLATYIRGSVTYDALSSSFTIQAEPVKGVSMNRLTKALDATIETYLKEGPSEVDIARAASKWETFLRNTTSSNAIKAQMLAENLLVHNQPLRWLEELNWLRESKPEVLTLAANEWFSIGYHEAYHIANDEFSTRDAAAELRTRPAIEAAPHLDMPESKVFTLSNGLKVVHVEKTNTPNVEMSLRLPIGRETLSEEQIEIASLALDLMTYSGRNDLPLAQAEAIKDDIGLSISSQLGRFDSISAFNANTLKLDRSLDIWTSQIVSPEYTHVDVEREIKLLKIDAQGRQKRAEVVADQIMREYILGDKFNYTDQEVLEALEAILPEDLTKFHSKWVRPDGATLYVVGDISTEDLRLKLENRLKNWRGTANWPEIKEADVPTQPSSPTFILINKPDTTQTELKLMRLADIDYFSESLGYSVANKVLGGGFTSRLNLNIREDKGWTYGIRSRLSILPSYSTWGVSSSVTSTATVDAIKEIINEIDTSSTSNPITEDEIKKTISADVKSMAYLSGTASTIIATFIESDRRGQPYDLKETESERLKALTVRDVNSSLRETAKTDNLIWTVVGDLSTFETELRAAKLGTVEVYDLSGKKLR